MAIEDTKVGERPRARRAEGADRNQICWLVNHPP